MVRCSQEFDHCLAELRRPGRTEERASAYGDSNRIDTEVGERMLPLHNLIQEDTQ